MKCTKEEQAERMEAQKLAQKRVEEKKAADKESRLKALADEKEQAMLRAARSRRPKEYQP